jgi:hypothetical protein
MGEILLGVEPQSVGIRDDVVCATIPVDYLMSLFSRSCLAGEAGGGTYARYAGIL